MRFVLLPADERVLVADLVELWSLRLLQSDVLDEHGVPVEIAHPRRGLPAELPVRPIPLQVGPVPRTFLFWRPDWEVNELPGGNDAVDRVAREISSEAATRAGIDPRRLLDTARTPVIRYRRSGWIEPDVSIHPGALQGMSLPTADWPGQLLDVYRDIERALVRHGERLDPRFFTSDRYTPRIIAFPHAMEWIANGGRIYPWDA